MPSPLVCYVPACKHLAAERCADCMKPICYQHAWQNLRAQSDPDDFGWRCPLCYPRLMDRRFREATEELQAAKVDLANARLEVAAMAREAGLCIPTSSSDASTTP